ncbi:MAG: DUF1801 domain-containing protein [Hyphomicrobiaceae bacterium]
MSKRTVKAKARSAMVASAKPVLLSGGNPQIAKAAGDAPVQCYIAAMPGWKQDIGRRVDELITATIPGVRKAVKWNSPLYGMADRMWFLSLHCFTRFVRIGFFQGALLVPMPPGLSKQKEVRYLDIYEGEAIDERKIVDWVRQASELPGVKM